jgi:hypothetical protein
VTLIAAIRTDKGAVICADSKETHLGFYVPVNKIDKLDLGNYWGVIGGAGNEGGLIDGLVDILADRIKAWPVGLPESAMKDNVRFILADFYSREVKLFCGNAEPEKIELIICLKDKAAEEVFLWRTDKTVLFPVDDVSAIGYESAIYENEGKRLYGKGGRPWTARAVALGVHLLAFGKDTSDWIGGDTRVIIANESGMARYEREDVEILEERAQKFREALAELTLALPDVTVTEGSFIEILGGFEERVLALRGYYLRRLAQSLAQQIGTGETDIRGELPMPSDIPIGGGLTVHIKPKLVGLSFGVTRAPQPDSQKPEDEG